MAARTPPPAGGTPGRDRVVARLRSAFGPLYPTLIEEAPEREAWSALGFDAVEAAIERARARVGEPGHALGFKTLLKQELDATCDLAPPIQPFEASSLPPDRAWRQREVRRDERARERERAAQGRRNDLYAQARDLLAPGHARRNDDADDG
ncbi:MAG: hypothetical protein RI554_08690 [Trueperaceae bacterium]|nr:hypothetical protein [Trueperaceae bacterium]